MKNFISALWRFFVRFFSSCIIRSVGKGMVIGIVIFSFLSLFHAVETVKEEVVITQMQNQQLYQSQAEIFTAAYSMNNQTLALIEIVKKQLDAEIISQNSKVTEIATKLNSTESEMVEALDAKAEQLIEYVAAVQEKLNDRSQIIEDVLMSEVNKPKYDYLKSITVVLIEQNINDKTRGSMGTGVIIKVSADETYIVTNNHVCDWAEDAVCYVKDGTSQYPISSVKKNSLGDDIQVVKFSGKIEGKQAVIGLKESAIQDRVFMVGHNLGNPFLYAEGTIAGYQRKTDYLVVGMPSGPGNSGSGIITKDGYLTGLLFAGQVLPVIALSELGESIEVPLGAMDTSHGLCVNFKVLNLFLSEYFN